MGLRDASKEFGGQGASAFADGGAAAPGEDSVSSLTNHLEPEVQNRKSAGVRAALFALSFYKSYLSMLFAGSCRFEPTCSRYAYEAIERFGVWRGLWLGTKRLLRCQPLSRKFGYDPVPEKWETMHTNCGCGNNSNTHEARS